MDTLKVVKAARKVIDNADDAGCEGDLTVTSKSGVKALSKALSDFDADMKVVLKPLTVRQIKEMVGKGDMLTVVVPLDLDELGIGKDCLNDALSTIVTGDDSAMEDISCRPVGVNEAEQVLVEVNGSVENWLKERE